MLKSPSSRRRGAGLMGWRSETAAEEGLMRSLRLDFAAALVALSILAAGCGHKLVAVAGKQTVPVYLDEQTYLKLSQLKKQGGMAGMIGGLGENFAAKQVDDKTPVKIISSDERGSVVEMTEGPNKGLKGFVPKDSIE